MDISAQGLISLIVWLIIGGLVFWLAVWTVAQLALPDPMRKVVLALVGLVAIIIILNRMGILA